MAFGRRRVAAAVCVLPLLLAGCAGDPEPKLAPPSETPTTESPSATPTREPWEKKTNAGAVAFAKHWIDTFSEAMNSGDSERLRMLSAKNCETCSAVADRIDKIEASGGYYRSPGWKVLQAVPTSGTPAGVAIVSLRILQGEEEFKETSNSDVVRNPRSRAIYEASFRWVDGAWSMTTLRLMT